MSDHDFEAGVREGRLKSLEQSVSTLTRDIDMLKRAIWALYGAIALVQFLPTLGELFKNGQ